MGLLSWLLGGDKPVPTRDDANDSHPSPSKEGRQIADIYQKLRGQVFTLASHRPSGEKPLPFTVLLDIGYPEVVATLLVSSEGSTSLYFSHGGAACGTGSHEDVRAHSDLYLKEATRLLPRVPRGVDHSLPAAGRVRFHFFTPDGPRMAEFDEPALLAVNHELSGLYHSAHAILADIMAWIRAIERNQANKE